MGNRRGQNEQAMQDDHETRQKQLTRRSAFTIMSNVRDNCEQSASKKLLMLVIASYCDADGRCFPGNRLLAKAMNKSQRTVKRMIKELVAEGELEILTTGGGDQKRIIRLTRYVAIAPEMPLGGGDQAMTRGGDQAMTRGGDQAMTRGVVTPLHRQTVHNSHKEQPINNIPSAHAEFVRLWCERYQTVTGERYAFQGGKDGRHVKKLLASSGKTPSQLVEVAEAAWKRPNGFWCKQAASISGFNSRFNEIRQEVKNGTDKRKATESDRNIGTANEGKSSQYAGVGKVK